MKKRTPNTQRGLIVNESCSLSIELEGKTYYRSDLWELLRRLAMQGAPMGLVHPKAKVVLRIGDEVYDISRPITDNMDD